MASPSKYKEFTTTDEDTTKLSAEQLEHYVINPMTIKNLEFDLFNYCLKCQITFPTSASVESST